MRFSCPNCHKTYRLPPERVGQNARVQVSCPNCKSMGILRNLGGEILEARLLTAEISGPVITELRPASTQLPVGDPVWFVAVAKERRGPMTPVELAELLSSQTITSHSLVWQKGMANWQRLQDVSDLRGLLRASASVAAEPAQTSASVQGAASDADATRSTAPMPAETAAISAKPAFTPAPHAVKTIAEDSATQLVAAPTAADIVAAATIENQAAAACFPCHCMPFGQAAIRPNFFGSLPARTWSLELKYYKYCRLRGQMTCDSICVNINVL